MTTTRACANCGVAATQAAAYCAACGAELHAPAGPVPAHGVRPRRQLVLPDLDGNVCLNCGAQLGDNEQCLCCLSTPLARAQHRSTDSLGSDLSQAMPVDARADAPPPISLRPTWQFPTDPGVLAPAGHMREGTAWSARLKSASPWGLAAVALGVVALILVLASVDRSKTITGTFTVIDEDDCNLSLGYMDIHPGTQVTVTDGSGKTLATGSLGTGDSTFVGCEFSFIVDNVPPADSYGVSVSHRGTIDFDRDELEGDDWNVELTLGG